MDLTADEGNTYYEQYNTICSGVVKTGDCVYVATDGGRQLIAQIDTIWDTKEYVLHTILHVQNQFRI